MLISYQREIRPLFRESDRSEMLWAFDLWDPDDVRQFADQILERIQMGDMPCDTVWTVDDVRLLERWIDDGMAD